MIDKEKMIKNMPKPMQKFEPRVQMKADDKVAHLYLYGDVIEDGFAWDKEEDYISALKVRNELSKLDGQDLVIHLNSFGGMTFEGVAIYNILMDYKGKIDIQIDGIAASAASIIAMAGRTISGRPNSMLMIHKSWTMGYGNADDFRKMADDMDKIDESVKATYMTRFKGEESVLNELLKSETWMTANECLDYGFYDSVMTEELEEPEEEIEQEEIEQEEKPQSKAEVKTLFDLWNEQKQEQEKQNLFAKFKEAK